MPQEPSFIETIISAPTQRSGGYFTPEDRKWLSQACIFITEYGPEEFESKILPGPLGKLVVRAMKESSIQVVEKAFDLPARSGKAMLRVAAQTGIAASANAKAIDLGSLTYG